MTLLSMTLILFFIMDPIGNIASFLTVLNGKKPDQQRRIIAREMLISLVLMFFFYLVGEAVLGFLGLSEVTLRVTSGLILFIVGIGILFPSPRSIRPTLRPEANPILVPLSIPLTAGPSLLATIMLFALMDGTSSAVPLAIFFSWLAGATILFFGSTLRRVAGDNALLGAERLCGMILVMLAIQRFAEGVQLFIHAQPGAIG